MTWEQVPLDRCDEITPAPSDPGVFAGGASRPAGGCAALVLGLLSAWMLWMVQNFLDGGGWFDLIVGLILDELILAVGLFALVLLTWAIFAPAWLSRVLLAAHGKLTWAITWVGLLFGSAFLFILVGFMLTQLGVWK